MSMAQRDRLDRACLKFERAGSGRTQNSNLLNGPGRAEGGCGPGRKIQARPQLYQKPEPCHVADGTTGLLVKRCPYNSLISVYLERITPMTSPKI
jgi:hypothetical protein